MVSNTIGSIWALSSLLSSLGLTLAASQGETPTEPLSLDDLMAFESLENVAIDPTGRWLVYERIRPYGELQDYSFRTYAQRYSGHQIWRYDLSSSAEPELMPNLDPRPSRYFESFSPSGDYLFTYQYQGGRFSFGVYDMENEELRAFEAAPAYQRSGKYRPIWISESEFLIPVLPYGEQPTTLNFRVHASQTIAQAWEAAWRGDVHTAQEVRSRPDRHTEQTLPGTLLLVDAATGLSSPLADGMFSALIASPNTRLVAGLRESNAPMDDAELRSPGHPNRHTLVVIDLESGDIHDYAITLEFLPATLFWSADGSRVGGYAWPVGKKFSDGMFVSVHIHSGEVIAYPHNGLDLITERERGVYFRPERAFFLGENIQVYARKIPDNEDQTPRFTMHLLPLDERTRADWYQISSDGSVSNLTGAMEHVTPHLLRVGEAQFSVIADHRIATVHPEGNVHWHSPVFDEPPVVVSPAAFASPLDGARLENRDEILLRGRMQGDPVAAMVAFASTQGAEVNTLVLPTGQDTVVAGSLRSGFLALISRRGLGAQELRVRSAANRDVASITSVNQHLLDRDFGRWVEFPYDLILDDREGPAAHQVTSCVLLPPGSERSSPLPLVVSVYPSTRPRCSDDDAYRLTSASPYSPYLWAGRGYAYAIIATPREMIRTDEGPIAGIDHAIGAGVDRLVSDGVADPERILLFGHSQGGVSALLTAARDNRYRGVIALQSWANLLSHYFGGGEFATHANPEHLGNGFVRYERSYDNDFYIGRTPFIDPEIYLRNSPVLLAPEIESSIMLVHTDMDIFAMAQFDEMYGALKRSNKSVTYVRYLGEGHIISSPANIRDLWERFDRFAEEALTRSD